MYKKIWLEDLEQLVHTNNLPWDKLKYKTILVTGASGLIGSSLIKGLMYANQVLDLKLNIAALVRNKTKAYEKFADFSNNSNVLTILQGDIGQKIEMGKKIDFIVHGASPTNSKYFVDKPVETIKTAVNGTINMLELAKGNQVEGFVYLSSMEVYGAPQDERLLSEKDVGYIDPLMIRNCYPQSKRQCEALCAAYAGEYNVSATSVRLAQTFGPGVEKDDTRIFAEFARCIKNRDDIILLTDGSSKRCYLYTMDAITAILTVLLKGEKGKSYNVGNPKTYCSIREMAQMAAHDLADDKITVKIIENKECSKKFSPTHFYNLDIKAISDLGWKPTWGLRDMYLRMMESE